MFTYTYRMVMGFLILIWVGSLCKLNYITIMVVHVVGMGIFVMFAPYLSSFLLNLLNEHLESHL